MKRLVMFALALVVVLAVGHEGASYYDVVCDNVVISYVAYEPTLTQEQDVCNNY